MSYITNLEYLDSKFGNGQLEIVSNATQETQYRGDIKSFALQDKVFTVEVVWLAKADSKSKWIRSDLNKTTFIFNTNEWYNSCHGEGRIGLEHISDMTKPVFRIVPRSHRSCIPMPPNIA